MIKWARQFQTCWTHAAAFVTSPPLRDDPTAPEKLVDALTSGDLFMVASDNRGYTKEVKASAGGQASFTAIPKGLNGIEVGNSPPLSAFEPKKFKFRIFPQDRMSVVWEKGVESGKMGLNRFVSVTSANAAKAMNAYPAKGRIAEGSDADIVVWNRNNLRDISARKVMSFQSPTGIFKVTAKRTPCRTHHHGSDFNVFEGLKVHGAPEHVIVGGRVAVYEYQLNSGLCAGRAVPLPAYPPVLYDAMDDFAKSAAANGVAREAAPGGEVEEKVTAAEERKVSAAAADPMAGVTTPRRGAGDPVLNKRLGSYQRPVSAHGVRNQQGGNVNVINYHVS